MNLKRADAIDGNNPIERDLYLDATGDFVWVTGIEDVAQRIRQRLLHIRGDWFLDVLEGVPYRTQVFIKNPVLAHISLLFQAVIEKTPGVAAVLSASAQLGADRTLSISYAARTVAGDQIEDVLAL